MDGATMWLPPQHQRPPADLATSLRRLTLAVGIIETLALVYFFLLMLQSADPLGAALGRGITMFLAAPFVVLTVPGMVMAWKNRWLPLALALVVLAVPGALLIGVALEGAGPV
jgi:hypothetical protein